MNEDINNYILSFGDVCVTIKFQKVLNLLTKYKTEFDVLRYTRSHVFYCISEYKFMYFILVKNKLKKNIYI